MIMNKLFISFLSFVPMVASADYLNDKWTNLVKEKQELISELEKCQKNTKGFKIAGLATLGVSAIGVGVNIGEAVKINSLEDEINRAKNTCGTAKCEDTPSIANATKHVCINGVWKVETCAATHKGQNEGKCKRDGKDITYYDGCVESRPASAVFPDGYEPNASGPSVVAVGNRQWEKLLAKCAVSDNCSDSTRDEELGAIVGGDDVCIDGKWWSKGGECPEGYTHETKECGNIGEEIVYIRDCKEHLYWSSADQDQDHVNIAVAIEAEEGKDRNIVFGGSVKAAPDIGPCVKQTRSFKDVLGLGADKDVSDFTGCLPHLYYSSNENALRIGTGCVSGCGNAAKVLLKCKNLCIDYSKAMEKCRSFCKDEATPNGQLFRADKCVVAVAGVSRDGWSCLCNHENAAYRHREVVNYTYDVNSK